MGLSSKDFAEVTGLGEEVRAEVAEAIIYQLRSRLTSPKLLESELPASLTYSSVVHACALIELLKCKGRACARGAHGVP